MGGWRSWLGHWLTGKEAGAPAAVAAATLQRPPSGPPLLSLSHPPSGARPAIAWMATPVHLVAGLTSVHVDRRSILRLDANDQSAFAADFQRVFHDSGFQLQPLDSGDFLMLGPQMPLTETSEPARSMGASMADAQPADAANPSLRRLGAEIEMWLHDHAVNDARARLGEPPVTGLWLWGGAPIGDVAADVGDHAPGNPSNDAASSGQARGPSPGRALRRAHAANQGSGARETSRGGQLSDMGPPSSDIAFGRDAYLQGLWAAHDAKSISVAASASGRLRLSSAAARGASDRNRSHAAFQSQVDFPRRCGANRSLVHLACDRGVESRSVRATRDPRK